MMGKTLYSKVFDLHTVSELKPGVFQLFIGLHLIHEVTTPQAFAMLEERGLGVKYPELTFATIDHIIPTKHTQRPFLDILSEDMASELERNVKKAGIRYFSPQNGEQGIVHVIGPEQGLTQPGITICCGDSHTATHGAFGAIAFGIGTSQVRDVLATQTLATQKLKVRRINVNGKLAPGVYAKDVILYIINKLGANGGGGYAYEYGGEVFDRFTMEERMTVCNMSIEGSARCGYVNPDQITYDFIKGRPYSPKESEWDARLKYWESIKSDPDAIYDDVVNYRAEDIAPMVTWGIGLDQSISIDSKLPANPEEAKMNLAGFTEAMEYMQFQPGEKITGKKIDLAFLGSCTNARVSDFKLVAELISQNNFKVAKGVQALVVPGSQKVKVELEKLGILATLANAGFEIREPGCSMCLGMNPDQLVGDQLCASTSNRNYKGRMGSPTGRTLIMSPAMVTAAAVTGEIQDCRNIFNIKN